MKKVLRILLVFLLIISTYLVTYSTCAVSASFDIWGSGKKFLDTGTGGWTDWLKDLVTDAVTYTVFKDVIDFIWGLGLMVVLISTVVLGIKYMLVNPNEKSRVKQATTPYIIGVICIFGAVTIWKFIIDVLEGSIL